MDTISKIKTEHLNLRADYRDSLFREPRLQQLFLELTSRCNLKCEHCGSSCGDVPPEDLPAPAIRTLLREVRQHFGTSGLMLCITGGEPLLRKDFFEIMEDARDLGFAWGMTTNATLVDGDTALRLRNAGMKTVSVSLDGLSETHDAMRGCTGAFARAVDGIQALTDCGGFQAVQVTTVVSRRNIGELDALYALLQDLDIDSWRLTAIEPIGRALRHPELMLTPDDHRRLLRFIREERLKGMPLEYGCCHFLGLEFEREVRDWYFLCAAGRLTAGVMANGDIGACLDIERTEKTIQGNIFRDSFTDVWKNRFGVFRRSLAADSPACGNCPARRFCDGDSRHSWDEEKHEPRLCMRGILFD